MTSRALQNQRARPPRSSILRVNALIIASLTVFTTACTVYLLVAIASTFKYGPHGNRSYATSHESISKILPSVLHQKSHLGDLGNSWLNTTRQQRENLSLKNQSSTPRFNYKRSLKSNQTIILPKEWQPLIEASENMVAMIKPDEYLADSMHRFKLRLAKMSPQDLRRLLHVLQEKVNKSPTPTKKKREETRPSLTGANSSEVNKINGVDVIQRSRKMSRLMSYLESIESMASQLDVGKLNKLSAMDDNQSIVRVVKPEVMEAVFKQGTATKRVGDTTTQSRAVREAGNRGIDSVAPTTLEADWPEQEVVVEDWPTTVQPAPRKKKRKKKKKVPVTTTTTTTTTTPAPIIPETTTFTPPPAPSPPPQAFEEVWIEEEEDIVRPPRRKLKKYKKKTSPQETTTTTSTTTTTTTTTTTPAPTTTTTTVVPTTVIIDTTTEDWPEEAWPVTVSPKSTTTSAPLWPQKQLPEEQQWPEEAWLENMTNDIQNRVHIMYV